MDTGSSLDTPVIKPSSSIPIYRTNQNTQTYVKVIISIVFTILGYFFFLMSQYSAMKYNKKQNNWLKAYFYLAFVGLGIMLLGQIVTLGVAISQIVHKEPILSIYDQDAFRGNNKRSVSFGIWMILIGGIILCLQNIVFFVVLVLRAEKVKGDNKKEIHFVMANLLNSILTFSAYGMIAYLHSKKFRQTEQDVIKDNKLIIGIAAVFIFTIVAVASYYSLYIKDQHMLSKGSRVYFKFVGFLVGYYIFTIISNSITMQLAIQDLRSGLARVKQ